MRITHTTLAALVAILTLASHAPAQSTFTYQGELNESGAPVEGSRTLRFLLYDDATNPNPLENLGEHTVTIEGGLFSVSLETTDTFAAERFLEIVVIDTIDHVLTPRQRIDAAPRSIYSINTRGIHVTQSNAVGINTTDPGAQLEVRRAAANVENIRLSADNTALELRLATGSTSTSVQSWNTSLVGPATLNLNPNGGLVRVPADGIQFSDGSVLQSAPAPNLPELVGTAQAIAPMLTLFSGTSFTVGVTVPGALPGDFVILNTVNIDRRLLAHAPIVSSPNQVEFRISNFDEAIGTLNADTINVMVLRP